VAAFRAIETRKPEGERIVSDPFAQALIPAGIMFSISMWIVRSGLYERIAPGATGFILGRERYIDDYLRARLDEGLDQVVLLGAGFDTRAFRIPGIEATTVFAVDQPETQAVMLERLRTVVDPLPATIRFVPADLNTQQLGDVLRAAGYDEHARTLFIWQGVTYFLRPEGVDRTLAFIATHSAPGSSVVFDYIYAATLRDTTHGYGKMLARAGRAGGERYVFGIEKGEVESFLSQRGFCDVNDTTLEAIKAMYFTGTNATRAVVTDAIAIAAAKVCGAE
jgi:methyltransferase (TIGR00027 family)